MIILSQKPPNVSRKDTFVHSKNFRTLLNIFRNHRMPKNILRSSTKNCGTCRASHEDENPDKLTPLQYLNVKSKHGVFSLRMMSDELSSWKVALYARYRQAQSALQRLLDERAQLQQYLINTKRQVTSLASIDMNRIGPTYLLQHLLFCSLTSSSSSSSLFIIIIIIITIIIISMILITMIISSYNTYYNSNQL